MDNLFFARMQMAVSLGFHIIFAAVGIGMPFLMFIAEGFWLKNRDATSLKLAQKWAKGTAIFFAVGAVSGTVLSFELGLLWPEFMIHAGPIIGMPFSLEGFAFFTEAIFLGIYLYGWNRVSPALHWFSGGIVALSGAFSGIFVVAANGWMNTPTGFEWVNGRAINIDPIAAMLNPSAIPQAIHMTIAAYQAVGFAVAGVHAFMLLRDRFNEFHQKAFAIALSVGGIMAIIQPISGDWLAKRLSQVQPIKLAAMEGQFKTERGAPLRIGGFPDEETATTLYAIEIPKALSLITHHDSNAEIKGLLDFPRDTWPPVAIVHFSFQIMVLCGILMLITTLIGSYFYLRKQSISSRSWYLKLCVFCLPLGFIAIETGWIVTEVGRQPWIIYGIMKTSEAITPMPGLIIPCITFTFIYLFLGSIVYILMLRQLFDNSKVINKTNE